MRRAMCQMARIAMLLLICLSEPIQADNSLAALVAPIKALRPGGAGNADAARAWKSLANLDPAQLPALLAYFDDDQPLANNWLRSATDAIGEKALAAKKPLPSAELERFLLDAKNSSLGRRIAYEWLARVDKTAPTRLLPLFLHDRNAELRRDAVAARITAANAALKKEDKAGALAGFREALSGACDKDQVDEIAKELKGLGETPDLAKHFGFIQHWHLVAPFDNPKGESFAVVYPPEKAIDLAASYKGKGDAECRWTALDTADPYGEVDINKSLKKVKGAIAYAFTEVELPAERRAQIRVGCINAIKIFLNGKEVFSCDECHHGSEMDQYVVPVTLKAGKNQLLLKVCQNEQTEPWAQNWSFQARLSDATGVAIPFSVVDKK